MENWNWNLQNTSGWRLSIGYQGKIGGQCAPDVRKLDLDKLKKFELPSIKNNKKIAGSFSGLRKHLIISLQAVNFTLPKILEASAIVSVDAMVFRNDVIRDVV